jgi:glycosyltransferase involved in cell wall biosynthesis
MQQKSFAAERIHFTGKVSEAEMHSYYRAATVFVCASDHEGFCVPIVEAMSYDIPVIAYAAAAVPETMGDSGILVRDWDIPMIAEMINQLVRHQSLREKVIAAQRRNLQRFTNEQAEQRLGAALRFLGEQRIDPPLAMIEPQHSDERRLW